LKVYGYGESKRIKVITMNVIRNSGVEDDSETNNRCCVNDFKLDENLQRTKSKIFELAFCNPWDWFFTGTLNANKQDRTDLELFHKQFIQWLRNYSRLNLDGKKINFLLVPELHEDGKGWHVHGFLQGLPVEHLKRFQIGDKMGKKLAKKVLRGDIVYNWLAYAERFGFNDLEPIRNHEAVSKYITKYINKHLATSVTDLNAHQYYHSRGLNFAETIKKGTMSANIAPTYENEYCKVSWLEYSEELLQGLSDSFV
jgi:hypothetical protein